MLLGLRNKTFCMFLGGTQHHVGTRLPQARFQRRALQFCVTLPHSASFSDASLLSGWTRASPLRCCSGVSSLSLVLETEVRNCSYGVSGLRAPSLGESCFVLCPMWVTDARGEDAS